jgi:CHAD domain-containing protein
MAFRIRPDESVSHGLRRLATKTLKAARAELRRRTPPTDEAIHEARKGVKKVRAIVEAIGAGDDGRPTGKARKRLRRINRVLSPLRDADAMLATLAKLKSRNPRLFTEHTFARVRRELSLRKRKAVTGIDRQSWKKLDREFRALRASAKRWQLARHGFRALEPALRTTHRQGRRALARADKNQDAADFHEWRKTIKALWYQLRLLEDGGAMIRRQIRALHRAETCLGDEHNVVVLCAELSKDASVCPGPIDVDRLALAADRYQCELRQKALASARPVYRRKSRDYVRAIERAWKTARRHRGRRRDAQHRAAA